MLTFLAAMTPGTQPEETWPAITLVWVCIGTLLAILVWPRGRGRRLARQIFAVAVLAFREGLRLKVLWTVALMALLLGGLAFFTDADGTHAGRAFVILNYCLSSGEVLGAMLVVLLSALSVAREIESRVMHTFGTKPIPRWGILLGKALGFWSIEILFILGLAGFTALLVRAVPMRPEARSSGMTRTGTWKDLRRNALTTRQFNVSDAEAGATARMKLIKAGSSQTWFFTTTPEMSKGEDVSVRLLLSSTVTFASHIENLGIKIGFENEPLLIDVVKKVPQDRPFELYIPVEQMNRNGRLAVTLIPSAKGKTAPSVAGSVKMGIAADGLYANLLKSVLLIALQGWILAIITTSWSGILSFPVTVALGLILVLGGEMSRQVLDILQAGTQRATTISMDSADVSVPKQVADQLRFMLQLLPDFRVAGGPTAFVEGEFVSMWVLAKAVLMMGLVRGIGWAIPGIVLFQHREVGR